MRRCLHVSIALLVASQSVRVIQRANVAMEATVKGSDMTSSAAIRAKTANKVELSAEDGVKKGTSMTVRAQNGNCASCYDVDSEGFTEDTQGACKVNEHDASQCIMNGYICSTSPGSWVACGPRHSAGIDAGIDATKFSLMIEGLAACPANAAGISDTASCERAAHALGLAWMGSEFQGGWPKGCYYSYLNSHGAGIHFNNHTAGTPNSGSQLVCEGFVDTPPEMGPCCESFGRQVGACSDVDPDIALGCSGFEADGRAGKYCAINPFSDKCETHVGNCRICGTNPTWPLTISLARAGSSACQAGLVAAHDQEACEHAADVLGLMWMGTESNFDWPKGCYYAASGDVGIYFNIHSIGTPQEEAQLVCMDTVVADAEDAEDAEYSDSEDAQMQSPWLSPLFQCNVGLQHCDVGWSDAKKSWCRDQGIACFNCGEGLENCEVGWSMTKKQHCLEAGVECALPFDCAVGSEYCEVGWSKAKKQWCYNHGGFICFECSLGRAHCAAGWSVAKKQFCHDKGFVC